MKSFQRLCQWLRKRRVKKLKLLHAQTFGELCGCYAAGCENPYLEGRLAWINEQLRQLREKP